MKANEPSPRFKPSGLRQKNNTRGNAHAHCVDTGQRLGSTEESYGITFFTYIQHTSHWEEKFKYGPSKLNKKKLTKILKAELSCLDCLVSLSYQVNQTNLYNVDPGRVFTNLSGLCA
jgi:hypothetical protein